MAATGNSIQKAHGGALDACVEFLSATIYTLLQNSIVSHIRAPYLAYVSRADDALSGNSHGVLLSNNNDCRCCAKSTGIDDTRVFAAKSDPTGEELTILPVAIFQSTGRM